MLMGEGFFIWFSFIYCILFLEVYGIMVGYLIMFWRKINTFFCFIGGICFCLDVDFISSNFLV